MIALILWSVLARAEVSRLAICREALTIGDARFKFGQVTHSNATAKEYLASPVTREGKPRLVLMIGIPGSGKSTWAGQADIGEWNVISIDVLRSEIAGTSADAEVLFSPHVLARTRERLDAKFRQALAGGESILLDQNNLTPLRVHYAQLARDAGYQIEALVFSSAGPEVNHANVAYRPDHLVEGLSPDAIYARFRQFSFFNSTFRIGRPGPARPLAIEPFLDLVERYPNMQDARLHAPPEVRAVLEADQFDRVEFAWTPDVNQLPHDSPVLRKRPRLYAAITNKCNRACPWCCVYSNPYKNTFLTPDQLETHFPKDTPFDLQLEGGEPTIHPQLFDFVARFRAEPNAGTLILVTNAVKIPSEDEALETWLKRFGEPFTIKVSINHYLLERDANILKKAERIQRAVKKLGGARELILNVRLRKGEEFGNDDWVRARVEDAGLSDLANIFYLQSYGLASNEAEWEPPFTVNGNYVLINPDGTAHRGSLVDRANEMGSLR